jgi:hypothetical protein
MPETKPPAPPAKPAVKPEDKPATGVEHIQRTPPAGLTEEQAKPLPREWPIKRPT